MSTRHEILTTIGPLDKLDGWYLDHFGIAEYTLPVMLGGKHSNVGTLGEHVGKALDELPDDTLIKAFEGAAITYIGRGKVASIFLVGEESNGGNNALIATVSRCSLSNVEVESEFRNLVELFNVVKVNDLYRSLPTSTFNIPEPVALIKSSENSPAIYFSRLVAGATAYPDLSNRDYSYGYTAFNLDSPIGMDTPSISDDPYLKKEEDIDDKTYFLLRNKGKQVLEDLAFYLLGSAHLTGKVNAPSLNWGDLMISPTDPPTLSLTSFRELPIEKDTTALAEQFCTLLNTSIPNSMDNPYPRIVPLFTARILIRGLNKFLDSNVLKFEAKEKLDLVVKIRDRLINYSPDQESVDDLALHLKRAKDFTVSYLDNKLRETISSK